MKNVIIALLFLSVLTGCSSPPKKLGESERTKAGIYVKNKSLYDSIFIAGLYEYPDTISLIDSIIIVGKDTEQIPVWLPTDKPSVFVSHQDSMTYELTARQTGLTTISYRFMLKNIQDSIIDSVSGKAVLVSTFFLAAPAVPEDDETGESYLAMEWNDNSRDCWFSVCIGSEDDSGRIRANFYNTKWKDSTT